MSKFSDRFALGLAFTRFRRSATVPGPTARRHRPTRRSVPPVSPLPCGRGRHRAVRREKIREACGTVAAAAY